MLGISVLMPNDEDSNSAFFRSVNDRVWKVTQRE